MAKSSDYGLKEFAFPRGWFMVAEGSKVTKKPIGVRFFGSDFVLYRGESGLAVMLDAYCPHMSTHLGCNSTSFLVRQGDHVEGDSIRCPYHGWRFGPDGKCNDIPYSDVIPPGAQVRSWPTVEAQGAIYMWHDPEGLEPNVDLPPVPEWEDPSWIHWTFTDLGLMESHPIEFLDNMVDVGHLPTLHGVAPELFENEIRGHRIWQRLGGYPVGSSPSAEPFNVNTYYVGPGLLTSRSGWTNGYFKIERIAHTPVDDGTARIWHAVMIKSPNPVATPDDVARLSPIAEQHKEGFHEDFEIWRNKRPCLRPIQVPTDGNFLKARRWYRQFYYPRSRTEELLQGVEGVMNIKGVGEFPVASPRLEGLLDPCSQAFMNGEAA